VAYGDERLLARLFDNVVSNAARHCREGGRITVAGAAEADGPGWSAGRVTILVSDEGPGIPLGEWSRVLEPFERVEVATDSVVPAGQGLGLAIAREVARLHGGDIRVLSSSPEGTTFEIALRGGSLRPLSEAPLSA
jgi:signal transduction histidine kinase